MRIAYNNYIDVQRSIEQDPRPREKEDKTNDQIEGRMGAQRFDNIKSYELDDLVYNSVHRQNLPLFSVKSSIWFLIFIYTSVLFRFM